MEPSDIIAKLRTGSCTRETRIAVEELIVEAKRLQAIVDKLPKTADGAPIVPGMEVWLPGHPRYPGEVETDFSVNPCVDWPEKIYNPTKLYSTREAAEAVREER